MFRAKLFLTPAAGSGMLSRMEQRDQLRELVARQKTLSECIRARTEGLSHKEKTQGQLNWAALRHSPRSASRPGLAARPIAKSAQNQFDRPFPFAAAASP